MLPLSVKKQIVCGLLCILASLATHASAQRPSANSAAPQSQPRLDLSAVFGSIAQTGPGCVGGVAINGVPASITARGQADLEHPGPLTASSIFETGSLAKQFTAAAMLLLVQDGKLSLDDDIRRYLSEIPDYGTPVTIRHLLTHTSGLREQWSLLALAGSQPGTQVHSLAVILDLASRQKGLNFKPGAEFLYTNTNYALAAAIIERVSGQSLQRFSDQRLFQPLRMTHTRWRDDFRTIVPGRATAYSPTDAGFITNMPFTNVYGNGGLLTTVADLLSWNAFLDKPSDLPGGQALVKALETPGHLSNGATLEYGLGLEVNRDQGRRLVSHSGSTGGYKTWLGRYPEEQISVAVMCNHGGIDPIEMGKRVTEQALLATGKSPSSVATMAAREAAGPLVLAMPQAPTKDLSPYEGLFRNPVTGELLRVEIIDGQLALKQGSVHALNPLGEGRFKRADGDIVEFSQRGAKAVELFVGQGLSRQKFLAVQAAATDIAALSAYVGTYYSAELDTRITIALQGKALVMRQPFAIEWVLSPSFSDGFTARLRGTSTFVFKRGADGQIIGFGAWANGVRDLAFVRQ